MHRTQSIGQIRRVERDGQRFTDKIYREVLFGAAHVPVRRGLWPWPFMAFGMGLVFGWMFLEFGDLTGPILAHATINFLNLRYIAKNSC